MEKEFTAQVRMIWQSLKTAIPFVYLVPFPSNLPRLLFYLLLHVCVLKVLCSVL